MSSRSGTSREDERRLNLRTLVIASIASAVAAIVVSRFWRSGTPIAAAMTPLIVTLISEMLHRPTTVIARKLTTDFQALPDDGGRIEPADPDEGPRRDPQAEREARLAAMGGGSSGAPRATAPRRELPVRLILVTGLLAFAIAAAVLTLPELIAGQSFGRGNTHTTIFGGNKNKSRDSNATQDTTTDNGSDQQQQQQTDQQQQTAPQTTTPAPQQKTTPQTTTPAPTTTAPSTRQQQPAP